MPREFETVRAGLPWSRGEPILFHVLTSLPRGKEGAAGARAMARSMLSPSDERGKRSRVKEIDARAGDGRFLFFSSCRPYRGDEASNLPQYPHADPALAFRWSAVAARGMVGWRPHDLLSAYESLGKRARRARAAPPTDGHLRAVADAATIWHEADARELSRLWCASLEARGDERLGRRLYAEAKSVWAPYARRCESELALVPFARADDVSWSQPFTVPSVRAERRRYGNFTGWPESLSFMFGPEVLLRGSVPVAAASWVLDPEADRWVTAKAFFGA